MKSQDKERIEMARQAQREYYKQWRAKNKDKTRKYREKYWAKKAAEMKAGAKND